MKSFIRTDLACEREGDLRRRELTVQGCRVCEVRERREREWVNYATVHFSPLGEIRAEEFSRVGRAVSSLLESMAQSLVPSPRCVLVACLGNPHVTSDSLGPCVAHSLEVTRHVQLLDAHAFSRFGKGALCLVTPGVLGDTGIEAAELVRAAVRELGADLVVAVDALCAVGSAHLGAAVQICDHGLRPGSGLGNRRMAIDKEKMGCPVISIGVPTVIDSATLICDALCRAGICGVGRELADHLTRAKRNFVAPCDVDVLVRRGGTLLAQVIGECFGMGSGNFCL